MFPIIHLGSQIEAINKYIAQFRLSKQAVFLWLSYYGELVKPEEEKAFEKSLSIQLFPDSHIYRTSLGFQIIFRFVEFNQLEIQGLWR